MSDFAPTITDAMLAAIQCSELKSWTKKNHVLNHIPSVLQYLASGRDLGLEMRGRAKD